MNYSATDYIKELNIFRMDLEIYMKSLSSGPNFEAAKIYAEKIIELIAAQIVKFENSPLQTKLVANPVELRESLAKLHELMTEDNEKEKFSEYISLLDQLIIHEVGI